MMQIRSEMEALQAQHAAVVGELQARPQLAFPCIWSLVCDVNLSGCRNMPLQAVCLHHASRHIPDHRVTARCLPANVINARRVINQDTRHFAPAAQAKVRWYAENQQLLDANTALIAQQAEVVQQLEKRLAGYEGAASGLVPWSYLSVCRRNSVLTGMPRLLGGGRGRRWQV